MVIAVNNPVPVPHDVQWYWVMGLIVAGGALTVWGVHGMVNTWLAIKDKDDRRTTMIGDFVALVICVVAGSLVGWRVWDTILGGASGLLGGFGYKKFVPIVGAFLRKKFGNGGLKQEEK